MVKIQEKNEFFIFVKVECQDKAFVYVNALFFAQIMAKVLVALNRAFIRINYLLDFDIDYVSPSPVLFDKLLHYALYS